MRFTANFKAWWQKKHTQLCHHTSSCWTIGAIYPKVEIEPKLTGTGTNQYWIMSCSFASRNMFQIHTYTYLINRKQGTTIIMLGNISIILKAGRSCKAWFNFFDKCNLRCLCLCHVIPFNMKSVLYTILCACLQWFFSVHYQVKKQNVIHIVEFGISYFNTEGFIKSTIETHHQNQMYILVISV
jgi:hypothetical protein